MLWRLPLKTTTTPHPCRRWTTTAAAAAATKMSRTTTSTSMTSHKNTMAVMHHLATSTPTLFAVFCSVLITYGRHRIIVFFTVDLNIPLDEFGAVDFSYIGNDAGKVFSDDVYL